MSASKRKLQPGRGPGMGNTAYIRGMIDLRHGSATTPETHGNRRIKSRSASKRHAITFGN